MSLRNQIYAYRFLCFFQGFFREPIFAECKMGLYLLSQYIFITVWVCVHKQLVWVVSSLKSAVYSWEYSASCSSAMSIFKITQIGSRTVCYCLTLEDDLLIFLSFSLWMPCSQKVTRVAALWSEQTPVSCRCAAGPWRCLSRPLWSDPLCSAGVMRT